MSPVPGHGRHGMRRWAIVAGAVAVILVAAVLSLPRGGDGPRVVTDQSFVAAANARCKATLAGLRPPFIGEEGKKPTLHDTAQSIDQVADQLHGLTASLQTIPVGAADQSHVAGWLGDWNRYTDIGYQYASALRACDDKGGLSVSREGDFVQRRADRFARANGIDKCQFHAVPHGGSDPFSGGM